MSAGVPLYLRASGGAVAGFFHEPPDGVPRRTPVLLCPPFGWDDVSCYRSRRHWAAEAAAAGFPALRIDLPGAGDSAGKPGDPDRLGAWREAVASAASWLGGRAGTPHVTGVGIGLGGLVACLAAADGAPIGDLVLWGSPARGRTLLRELRAFAALKGAEFPDPEAVAGPPTPDGGLEVAGFLLSAETIAALEAVDLAADAGATPRPPRALVLGRDGTRPDERLRTALEAAGAAVTVGPGEGYGEMMAGPQFARSPRSTIAASIAWLAEAPEPGGEVPPAAGAVEAAGAAELDAPGGGRVREAPFPIETGGVRLHGVLSEPVGHEALPIALLLVNGGAVRHIGPSRMWVEAARRWAARGVPTLRLDIEGLGDSDGDETRYVDTDRLYDVALASQVIGAVDALEARGVAERFVVGGLCAGAFWAFHALHDDARVRAAFMVNLWAFFWDDDLPGERRARRVRALSRTSSWRRVLRGEASIREARALLGWLARTPLEAQRRAARRRARRTRIGDALDDVCAAGKHPVLVFSRGEPVLEELRREGILDGLDRWPGLEVHGLPARDHTFRALWLQERVHELLDRTVAAEVAGTVPAPG